MVEFRGKTAVDGTTKRLHPTTPAAPAPVRLSNQRQVRLLDRSDWVMLALVLGYAVYVGHRFFAASGPPTRWEIFSLVCDATLVLVSIFVVILSGLIGLLATSAEIMTEGFAVQQLLHESMHPEFAQAMRRVEKTSDGKG